MQIGESASAHQLLHGICEARQENQEARALKHAFEECSIMKHVRNSREIKQNNRYEVARARCNRFFYNLKMRTKDSKSL